MKNVPAYFRTDARFMETRQVGLLVRNPSGLFDLENHPNLPQKFPKVLSVLQAYRDAGRELITDGRISWRTQRRANQEVIPLPFFHIVKRFKPIKRQIIAEIGWMEL